MSARNFFKRPPTVTTYDQYTGEPDVKQGWSPFQKLMAVAALAGAGVGIILGANSVVKSDQKHRTPSLAPHSLVVPPHAVDGKMLVGPHLAGDQRAQQIAVDEQESLRARVTSITKSVLDAYNDELAGKPHLSLSGGVEIQRNKDGTITIFNHEDNGGTLGANGKVSGDSYTTYATFGVDGDNVDPAKLVNAGDITMEKADDVVTSRTEVVYSFDEAGVYNYTIMEGVAKKVTHTGGNTHPDTLDALYDEESHIA